MNLRLIQSVALLLWGWQSDLLLFAIPMALIWEGRFFLNRRWNLTKQDFYLIADLTAISLVLMIVFLFLNRADYHFISTLIQWLPILFFPLTIVVGYSTEQRLSLDILFYSLRRQKQPVTQSWDMDYFLFGFLIVGAGTVKDIGPFFFPVVSLLIFFSLLPLRSARYKFNYWLLACSFIFLAAFVTQAGIRETHLELRKRAQVWLAEWIQQRTNPLKTSSSIGQIGRLKASDKILYRIPPPADMPMPDYLQEAVYDLASGNNWSVMDARFTEVEPVDDFLWDTGPFRRQDTQLDIYHEFSREKEVIPLPPGTTRIQDLPAINIQQSHYGVVQGLGLVPSPRYQIFYNPEINQTGQPQLADTQTSATQEQLFSSIIEKHRIDPNQPIESLQRYFADFRYSLYQPEYLRSNPLEEFLLTRKAGHCEFFATTTVLLLREMGIPARYVTGFAIQEYDELLGMFVIRQRHAHAWAIAYIDGRWRAVDTTPSIWLETESAQSTLLQPIFDLVGNLTFLLQLWWNEQTLEDYKSYLYGLGFLLALILLWRISKGEQVILKGADIEKSQTDSATGKDSPLLQIESALETKGFRRDNGELFLKWFSRIGMTQYLDLLPLHNRLRFHPKGLDTDEEKHLTEVVAKETAHLLEEDQPPTNQISPNTKR